MSVTTVVSAWATGYELQVMDCNLDPESDVVVRLVDRKGDVKATAVVHRDELIKAVHRRRRRHPETLVETRIEYWRGRAEQAQALVRVEREYKERAIDRANEAVKALEEAEAVIEQQKTAIRLSHSGAEMAVLEHKLEEAEAAVERVRGWAAFALSDPLRKALLEALGEEPFELPEDLPARIEAKDSYGNTFAFKLWLSGDGRLWQSEKSKAFVSEEAIMKGFTDHRVLPND